MSGSGDTGAKVSSVCVPCHYILHLFRHWKKSQIDSVSVDELKRRHHAERG